MKLPSQNQRGYILLVLLLFVALLSIGMLSMVERIDSQIKRDREEELIHRGVQYSRAVRRYFKKFGRYPTRIEELESSNNLRFLRKRYKDPVTGKDFKPLHMTDVQISFNPAAASGLPPGPDANISAAQPGSPGVQEAQNGDAGATTGGPSTIPQGAQPDQPDAAQASQPVQPVNGALSQIQPQGATGK